MQAGKPTMAMTQVKLELAAKLDELDPGGFLPIDPKLLEQVFGSGESPETMISAAERFAEEHDCTFFPRGHFQAVPEFTKDDVF